tara:strand:+ start:217 stop:816 length:600 start_codon:yes stop_codon:yes gene_type:complete
MPTIITRGAASAMGFGLTNAIPYVKPLLLAVGTGQTSTVTSIAAGYSISGTFGSGTETYYLNKAKTSGKWYWEATYTSNQVFHGITDAPATTATNGGYTTANAGVYSGANTTWIDSGWTGTAVTGTWPGVSTGNTIGFALDMDSATKTLRAYVNNTLGVTLQWTGGAPTLYPMVCPYADMEVRVNTGCTYSPPSGYSFY